MTPAQLALWLVLGVALVTSVVTDVLSRRILDAVTYPAIVLALGIRAFAGGQAGLSDPTGDGLLSGLLGALALFALFALFAWRGKMGWGDAKLVAVVGACLGLPLAAAAAVFTSLVGAAQAVVTLLWKGELSATLSGALRRLAVRAGLLPPGAPEPARHIPYAIAIALGSLWAVLWERTSLSP